MNVLMLGLDKNILTSSSRVAKRQALFSSIVDSLDIVVPFQERTKEKLAQNVTAYGSGGKNKIVQSIRLFYLAKKLTKMKNITVISCQDTFFLGLISIYLGKRFNVGVEIQVHGKSEKQSWFRAHIQTYVLSHATRIRTVSNRMMKYLVDTFSIQEENIGVVPVYTDTSEFAKVERNRSDKDFVFFTASRLVPIKQVDEQIKAVSELVKKGYQNIQLRIAGDGPEKERLVQLVKKLELQNHVIFLGWIEYNQLAQEYANADCFLLTSMSEGWGAAVVEAAVNSIPVIMTDVGCAGEVIVHNKNGYIAKSNSDILRLMSKMINNDDNFEEIGYTPMSCNETLLAYKQNWKQSHI